jgi:hypothetical protein
MSGLRKKQSDYKRQLRLLLTAVVKGMDYDPGHSDLDDEQPVHVCIPLGEYRRANTLLFLLEDFNGKT